MISNTDEYVIEWENDNYDYDYDLSEKFHVPMKYIRGEMPASN